MQEVGTLLDLKKVGKRVENLGMKSGTLWSSNSVLRGEGITFSMRYLNSEEPRWLGTETLEEKAQAG